MSEVTGFRTTFMGLFAGAEHDDQKGFRLRGVEIPLIQRDYAQGRQSNQVAEIRSTFLQAIHDAIAEDRPLSLDFVYGGVEQGVFRPLDGQQRLTTLFLLHWYLWNRQGRDVRSAPWGQFSYDTRPGARRFCELLMESNPPCGDEWESLSDWVIDQPWYQYPWKQDPTIASMRVMLDGIHEYFCDLDPELAWSRLTDPARPAVSFIVLPIEEVGTGDELYIKMNSRGKPLTPFENFKARFEQVLLPAEVASRIALKIDKDWADILWPYRGSDNIVDDEFMRFFEYLVDICEWRRGEGVQGHLLDRASALLGGGSPQALESLAFFEDAFDAWSGLDVGAYFESLFREPQATRDPTDERPTLFTPEWLSGLDLFGLCCQHYGQMRGDRVRAFPLGHTLLLHAVTIHRLEGNEDVVRRLRILRNLVEASENELRADRMPDLIDEVERFMRTGDLSVIKSLNQAQVADEVRKAKFLRESPDSALATFRLEDHRLLRGSLAAIELDSETLPKHAVAFERIFSDRTLWPEATGALLALGEYQRRRNGTSFYFGAPRADMPWRQLLTGPASEPVERVRQPLAALLGQVGADGDLASVFRHAQDEWIRQCEREAHFDWRYYLVRYPIMRTGASGIYISADGQLGYDLCMMQRAHLNSNYRDPYLSAIYESLKLNRHQLVEPWFSGRATQPRWLRIRRTDIAVRSVPAGLEFAVPDHLCDVVGSALRQVADVEVQDGGFLWTASQVDVDGQLVDSVDRVSLGVTFITRILGLLEPEHLLPDMREFLIERGNTLSELISEQLRTQSNLGQSWVYVPQTGVGVWVGFELDNRRCVELVLRPDEHGDVTPLVLAYPSYGKMRHAYPEFNHIPLGTSLAQADEDIARTFLQHVDRFMEAHPRQA